jgi:hypothetical protein
MMLKELAFLVFNMWEELFSYSSVQSRDEVLAGTPEGFFISFNTTHIYSFFSLTSLSLLELSSHH